MCAVSPTCTPAPATPITASRMSCRAKSPLVTPMTLWTNENNDSRQRLRPTTSDTDITVNHHHSDTNQDGNDSEDKEGSYESLDELSVILTPPEPVVYQGLSPRR